MFGDIISSCLKIYHPQKFGTLVCVPVMERSANAKARVLAMQECRICVEHVGVNAIGKRGMLHVCKTLSEEALVENRIAALDLIEEVIRKLNGDTKRLYIACANSLSDKAKGMIEERWSKHNSPAKESVRESDAKVALRRKDNCVTFDNRSTDGLAKSEQHRKPVFTPTRIPSSETDYIAHEIRDTATFKLHLDEMTRPGVLKSNAGAETCVSEEGPFTFRYHSSRVLDFSTEGITSKDPAETNRFITTPLYSDKEVGYGSPYPTISSKSLNNNGEEGDQGRDEVKSSPKISSSAASLRARLKKIRDRTSLEPNQPPPPLESFHKVPVGSALLPCNSFFAGDDSRLTYRHFCDNVDLMLGLYPPVPSTSPELAVALDAIEKLQLSIGSDISELRKDVESDISGFVSRLTRQVLLQGTF